MSTIFTKHRDSLVGEVIFATESTNTDPFSSRLRKSWHMENEARLAAALNGPDDMLFDIGANIGAFCLPVMLASKAKSCVAVEGLPRNAELLTEAAARNGIANVTVRNVAIAAAPGSIKMSGSSAYGIVDANGDFEVPAVTIDQLTAEFGVAHCVKIDVEGSELAALSGAKETLAAGPDIIIEGNGAHSRRVGHFPQDLLGILRAAGYALWLLDRSHLIPVAPDDFQPGGNVNYFASKREYSEITGFTYRPWSEAEFVAMTKQTMDTMGPRYKGFMRDQVGRYRMPAAAQDIILAA